MIRNLLCVALLSAAASVSAATITVNSLSDASGCSLRNAILAANTNTATVGCAAGTAGTDTITITVSGTYSPTTELPATTEAPTITATLPNFVLDGSAAGSTANGLTLGGGTIVRGLVVQGFGGSGILIQGSSVTVAGNRIGTDATGTTAAPNCTGVGMAGGGVRVLATTSNINSIEIGGSTSADHNVISGNQCSGILVEATQTGLLSATAEGNYIGVNYCGCDALPNTGYGVDVQGAKAYFVLGSQLTFGNVCSGRCNVVASNALGQVRINNSANGGAYTGTNVWHNVIGANANMTAGLPTDTAIATGDGVLVASRGVAFIDGNVIVRSTGAGIRFDGGATGTASSNGVGVTVQGSTIPNAIGIRVHDTTAGTTLRSNTVAGNTGAGVWLDGAQHVTMQSNLIGLIGGNSITPAANLGGGILVSNSAGQTAMNNLIGGADQPNTVAYNTITGHGPAISVASGVSNQISENSIYGNFGTLSSLGIDLGADGPDANDPCDSDSGPNNRQNSPVITYAARATINTCSGCGTRAAGTLIGQANTQYRIELFTNPAGSSTPGQSQGYLGAVNTTTDASCNASWVLETIYGSLANVVATATSPTGDTSELSAPVTAWAGQVDPRYDANSDGFTDLLLRNYSNGANAAWLLDGQQNLLSIQNLPALPNTDYHLESNFSIQQQGGNRNILWRNYTTGANAIWIMNGTANDPFAIVDLPALPNPQYYVGGTADFNGDGSTDILWRNNTTGAVAIWLMNGTNYVSTVNLPSVGIAQWTIAGTGDFNDDGRADILWHNTSTAANAIWFMDGTAYVSTQNIQSIPNTAYVPVAIGDYNGDHHSDIVWHNTTTGANAIWLMNGTTLGTIANLPTVPNTNIVPAGPR